MVSGKVVDSRSPGSIMCFSKGQMAAGMPIDERHIAECRLAHYASGAARDDAALSALSTHKRLSLPKLRCAMAAALILTNFINGEFVPPRSGLYLDNFCPATGEVCSIAPSYISAALLIEAMRRAWRCMRACRCTDKCPTAMHRTSMLLWMLPVLQW